MNIQDLTFKTPLDIADLFKEEKKVTYFLTEFFDCCHTFYEESKGKYIPIVRNESTSYYNIDFDLFVYSFLKFLESEGVNKNALARASFLFSKIDKWLTKKSTIFLLNLMAYHGVTSQQKGGFFYMPILGQKIKMKLILNSTVLV